MGHRSQSLPQPGGMTHLPFTVASLLKHIYIHLYTYILLHSRAPMASFYDGKHSIISMHLDDVKGQLVTCGTDRIVKVSVSRKTSSQRQSQFYKKKLDLVLSWWRCVSQQYFRVPLWCFVYSTYALFYLQSLTFGRPVSLSGFILRMVVSNIPWTIYVSKVVSF